MGRGGGLFARRSRSPVRGRQMAARGTILLPYAVGGRAMGRWSLWPLVAINFSGNLIRLICLSARYHRQEERGIPHGSRLGNRCQTPEDSHPAGRRAPEQEPVHRAGLLQLPRPFQLFPTSAGAAGGQRPRRHGKRSPYPKGTSGREITSSYCTTCLACCSTRLLHCFMLRSNISCQANVSYIVLAKKMGARSDF